MARIINGFESGVGGESKAVFFGGGDFIQIWKRFDID
jgi:hypothetical protein